MAICIKTLSLSVVYWPNATWAAAWIAAQVAAGMSQALRQHLWQPSAQHRAQHRAPPPFAAVPASQFVEPLRALVLAQVISVKSV